MSPDEVADRFVELACLTYGPDEGRARREEAEALRAATPELVRATVHAAAAAGDPDALGAWLARDPASVSRTGTARAWAPILALCYSRVRQDDARACLELLLAHGADPAAHVLLGGCRFTALAGVMGEGEAGPLEQPPHGDARALAERLLDAGASPDESQGLYNTHFAPSDAWLELLLARGLRATSDLDFLLGQAAVQGFAARARLLLAHGAAADGRSRYNHRTHRENALLEGHGALADLLAAAGAAAPSFDAKDALRVAVLAGDAGAARGLVAATPGLARDGAALRAAARHDRLEALELGLDLGLPIDDADHQGLTALHHAARAGHLRIAQRLVERGASLAVRDRLYRGTPLGHAEHFGARWPRPHGDALVAFLRARSAG